MNNPYWTAMYRFLYNGCMREYFDLMQQFGIRGATISLLTVINPGLLEDMPRFLGNARVREDLAKQVVTDYWRMRSFWGSMSR